MLNMANWSPELKALYQKKYPGGGASASPMSRPRPISPSMAAPPGLGALPEDMLGQRALPQASDPYLGMPGPASSPMEPSLASSLARPRQAPTRIRRETDIPQPTQASLNPGTDATVDDNALANVNPPPSNTGYTRLQKKFQQIDADKAYTDQLSLFEPSYQKWRDYYTRTGKTPWKFQEEGSQWPQRMQDYYDAWTQVYYPDGIGSVAGDPNNNASVPSLFEEIDAYLKKLKLAQRDDPNYVPAGGDNGGETMTRQAIPGVYPEAMRNYKGSKFTPDELKFLMQEITPSIQTHRTAQQEGKTIADDLSGGRYDVGDLMSPGLEAQTTGQPDPSVYDPVLKHAMDSVIERYQRDIMPGISDEAQAYGQYGGSRQGVAEGLAAKGLEETLGGLSARMNLEAYKDAQSRVIPATQARAGLRKSSLQDRFSNRERALLQRSARTQEADDYVKRMFKNWRYGPDTDSDALTRYLSLLQQGSPGPSTAQTKPQYRNKTAEILGMVGTLASLGSLFPKR